MSASSVSVSARVLIVEDHPVYRDALADLLRDQPWVEAVVEAATIADALRLAVVERVDVVLMDITLPDGNGLVATKQLLHARPQARVVILTGNGEDRTVAAALDSGASGYLIKNSTQDDIVLALHTVCRGGIVLGPQVGAAALRAQPTVTPEPFDRLGESDLTLVCRVVEGRSTARIAQELGLAEQTVRNNLSRIYRKVDVADRAALMVRATSVGLVCAPESRGTRP